MNLEGVMEQCWAEHAANPRAVAATLKSTSARVERAEQVAPLVQLVAHVFGEHLGEWADGIAVLRALGKHKRVAGDGAAAAAIARGVAALTLASGERVDWSGFSRADGVRVRTVAAAALAGRGETTRAATLFREALAGAEPGLAADDPVHRALAVAGNNLACALEEKATRTDDERALMLEAARAARRYWELAGTWKEVERAEYRLAMSSLKAGALDAAAEHARTCLAMCERSGAPALEYFFAHEACAQVARARGDASAFGEARAHVERYFARLEESDREWCEAALDALLQG